VSLTPPADVDSLAGSLAFHPKLDARESLFSIGWWSYAPRLALNWSIR